MAFNLVFMDGFDTYIDSTNNGMGVGDQLSRKGWDITELYGSNASQYILSGRYGGGSLMLDLGDSFILKTPTLIEISLTKSVVGFNLYHLPIAETVNSNPNIIDLGNNNNTVDSYPTRIDLINNNRDNYIVIEHGIITYFDETNGYIELTMPISEGWHYIEIWIDTNKVGNNYTCNGVFVDGIGIPGINSQKLIPHGGVSTFKIGLSDSGYPGVGSQDLFDDFYVLGVDNFGEAPNTPRILTRFPDNVGSTSEWIVDSANDAVDAINNIPYDTTIGIRAPDAPGLATQEYLFSDLITTYTDYKAAQVTAILSNNVSKGYSHEVSVPGGAAYVDGTIFDSLEIQGRTSIYDPRGDISTVSFHDSLVYKILSSID